MIATLQWLGIVPSFSRPHVCNDNPYSEALFRTLKHTPAYPRLPFADGEAARRWVARFVGWYNTEHHHSGIRYVTPDERHSGADVNILARRHALYEQARRRRPERWPETLGTGPRSVPWCSILSRVTTPWKPYDRGDNYLDAHRRPHS